MARRRYYHNPVISVVFYSKRRAPFLHRFYSRRAAANAIRAWRAMGGKIQYISY